MVSMRSNWVGLGTCSMYPSPLVSLSYVGHAGIVFVGFSCPPSVSDEHLVLGDIVLDTGGGSILMDKIGCPERFHGDNSCRYGWEMVLEHMVLHFAAKEHTSSTADDPH